MNLLVIRRVGGDTLHSQLATLRRGVLHRVLRSSMLNVQGSMGRQIGCADYKNGGGARLLSGLLDQPYPDNTCGGNHIYIV